MTLEAKASHGAKLKLSNGASTPVFTEILGVHNGPALNIVRQMATGRHHGSEYEIKKPSFITVEPLTFDVFLDLSNVQQAALHAALFSKARLDFELEVVEADGTVFELSAYVSRFNIPNNTEGLAIANVSLDVDGVVEKS